MSVLRTLQYENLSRCIFRGKTLDYGGGENADYHTVVSFDSYFSINIDHEIKPTWLVKVDEKIPVEDEYFDNVLSLNTFEHIYDVKKTLKELSRVLKSGGDIVISVPFLYPIHGHPNDYFRPTPGWWFESLNEIGFNDIQIEPLAWGAFSTGSLCSGSPGPFKLFRKHASLLLDILYTNIRRERSQSYGVLPFSVGFFVKAKKV